MPAVVETFPEGSIRIGFNAALLLEVLSSKSDKEVVICFTTHNRAAIFDGDYLLMPVMLKEYV